MIQVLWIDDECKNSLGEYTEEGRSFVESAYDNNIQINGVTSYDEGLMEIRNNPHNYIAVILDIRNQSVSEGNPADGFMATKDAIRDFHRDWHQQEPYIYVLSGEKQYQSQDTLIRKEEHQTKAVYEKHKKEDCDQLFNDIRKVEYVSSLYKCQCEYNDILEAINQLCGKDEYTRVLHLIVEILSEGHDKNADLINSMRKVLESLRDVLKNNNFEYFQNGSKDDSLNQLSIFIGNQKDTIPIYIRRAFHTVVNITQEGSHMLGKDSVDDAISSGQAPYLLRSCLFELFNIILWVKHYISET